MAAWRYEISLLVLKTYFTRSLCSLVKYFPTLEEKFHISARPCNILYLLKYFCSTIRKCLGYFEQFTELILSRIVTILSL